MSLSPASLRIRSDVAATSGAATSPATREVTRHDDGNPRNKIIALARPQAPDINNLIAIAKSLPPEDIKFENIEDLSSIELPEKSNLNRADLTGRVLLLNGGVKIAEVNKDIGNSGIVNIKNMKPFQIESKDFESLISITEKLKNNKAEA